MASLSPGTPGAPRGVATSYAYDPVGQLLQTQQSSSDVVLRSTSLTYTPTGKMATSTDANGNVTRFAYDAVDRLLSVADPVGRTMQYAYDALSRQISASNLAVQSAPLLQQTYTPDGLVANFTTARSNTVFSTTTFTPDGFDRLATTTYPDASTETLGYDADGNVLSRETRAGATIAFTYDTLNRLSTKSAPSEAAATYAYDLDGRLIGASDASATIATATPGGALATMNLSYDALNRPLNLSWTPAAAQAMPTASSAIFTYAYNAANQRIAQTATDNSYWSYPAPTAEAISYTANNLDQYSTVGGVTPTYDGNGDLTFDGTFTYGYDAEGRLISASGAGNSATYAYDALGRRKLKTVNGATTIFVQDPQGRALIDYSGATGAIGDWYAFGLGPNDALAQMNGAGTTRATYVPDIQGSIVASLDAASGVLTKTGYGYQPFGESATTAGVFRYTGARIDAETNGLYDFRARMYGPPLGRFWQPDRIGYAGGPNLYAYVGNDPLNSIDPFGRDTQWYLGGSATAALAIGGGFSLSGGINVPTNPLNIGGYQVFATLQGNKLLGIGGFAGAGVQGGFSVTPGPLPSGLSTSSGWYHEMDMGVGPSGGWLAVGASLQGSGNGPQLNQSAPPDIAGGSFGIPVKIGGGVGIFASTNDTVNSFGSVTLATPTAAQVTSAASAAAAWVSNALGVGSTPRK